MSHFTFPISYLATLLASVSKANESSITDQMISEKIYPTPTVTLDGREFSFKFTESEGTFFFKIYDTVPNGVVDPKPSITMLAFDEKYTRSLDDYKEVLMTMCGINSYPDSLYEKIIEEIASLLFKFQNRVECVSQFIKK